MYRNHISCTQLTRKGRSAYISFEDRQIQKVSLHRELETAETRQELFIRTVLAACNPLCSSRHSLTSSCSH